MSWGRRPAADFVRGDAAFDRDVGLTVFLLAI
jgi:hypothetical protein